MLTYQALTSKLPASFMLVLVVEALMWYTSSILW